MFVPNSLASVVDIDDVVSIIAVEPGVQLSVPILFRMLEAFQHTDATRNGTLRAFKPNQLEVR